jgi:archaellum component FlaC
VGRADIEDALKRLDKLTHEEARMATAQILKITNTVDDRVKGVAERVLGVDDRVANVGDRVKDVDDKVASVDNTVKGVDGKVASIDGRLKAVDDKVAVVVDGMQTIFSQSPQKFLILIRPDGKEAKVFIQQAANGLDQVKRS